MENNEVVELLREIRDLQKLHVENYKDALKNQREAIEVQRKSARLHRRSLLVLLVVVVIALALAYLPSLVHR
jgi:hypothetical protein